MSVRRMIVDLNTEGLNVSEFCREHGVSREFFYDLRRRYQTDGEAALEPRSRAPKTVANRTPEWVEDLIVDLRKELTGGGLDAGAETIHWHLPSRFPSDVEVPSEATIWRVLGRRGFITPEPNKAPKHAYRTFTAERANECWQLDDIDWELADGTGVKIITLIDDCTRVCPGLKAVPSCTGAAALDAFCAAAQRWGWPSRYLSDNAKAYRHALAAALGPLGIDHRHGRPYHPQTQGKVERFHQTLQLWLHAQPKAETLEELQAQLDSFAEIYNHQRPHRAIGRRTPASVFDQTPKTGPADRPLGATTSIHHSKVTNGTCAAGAYLIAVGAAHTGKDAKTIITGRACHVFIDGHPIRHLELDPTRRYQPLYDRAGRPKVV